MTTIYKVSCASIDKEGCEDEYFTDSENAKNRVTQLLNRDMERDIRTRGNDIVLKSITREVVKREGGEEARLVGKVKRKDYTRELTRWFRIEKITTKD